MAPDFIELNGKTPAALEDGGILGYSLSLSNLPSP